MKNALIKIFAWLVYVFLFLSMAWWGNLFLFFHVYGVGRDSTDAEVDRSLMCMLVYLIVLAGLFIMGGFLLYRLLKKKLNTFNQGKDN